MGNGANEKNTDIECKTLYIRKKFEDGGKCLCDVYFEYPAFTAAKNFPDKNIRKNLEKINSFYDKFAKNALAFAEKTAFDAAAKENSSVFLRIFFGADISNEKIAVSLILSERKNSRVTGKKILSQIWDIKNGIIIKDIT